MAHRPTLHPNPKHLKTYITSCSLNAINKVPGADRLVIPAALHPRSSRPLNLRLRPPVLAKLSGILRRQLIEWPLIEEYLGIFMDTIHTPQNKSEGNAHCAPFK